MNYIPGAVLEATAASSPDAAGSLLLREGLAGPLRLLKPDECKALTVHIKRAVKPPPADWNKGRAVTDRIFYDLATDLRLLEIVVPLLGERIVLWGASVVKRSPGQSHPWHTDIESSAPEGGFVSVWIGVENACRDSTLQFISRSHSMPPIQQVMHDRGVPRGKLSSEEALLLARGIDPSAALVVPDIHDGEALIFDGRIWHGSLNTREAGQRIAILLQYAVAEMPVRMPNPERLTWPFRMLDAPRPPVIAVRGRPQTKANRIVPPPPPVGKAELPLLSTVIRKPKLPLREDTVKRWRPYPQFRGVTRTLDQMSGHISVLSPGHTPHPPHAHMEEEILIVLDGEAEITIADSPEPANPRRERLGRGDFVYYPAFQHHTIHNPNAGPITYLMFKWHGSRSGAKQPLSTSIFRCGPATPASADLPISQQRVFEGPSDYLGKLHAHMTVLQPGAGYKPHSDPYDVAILVLSGEVKTLGRNVGPNGLIYYAAGESHGMENRTSVAARYIVFEFHRTAG